MNRYSVQRLVESVRATAKDETARSGGLIVALFVVTVLVNGMLALGVIEVLDALGWWSDSRLRPSPGL